MYYPEQTETLNQVKTLDYLIEKESEAITSENLLTKMQDIAALTQKREATKSRLNENRIGKPMNWGYVMPTIINLK